MDETVTTLMRKVVATQMTHRFMIQKLLDLALFRLGKADRLKFAEAVLDASVQTEQFDGVAKGDDLMAANLSEMIVLFQDYVDQIVGQSLLLVEEAEVSGAGEFYRKLRTPRPQT